MEMVLTAIQGMPAEFTLQQLEAACPGVGRDWIRTILSQMKQEKRVTCSGKGRGARWSCRVE